ncbi:MAG: type II toxin-antitoxin system RelE/ParE family toxin [Planctomycetes bacterium]|nr:type II toxin-antitoxin system RelE/ParE family toxin [Planctomycetota bacterium]
MSLPIIFDPRAEAEYLESVLWYESQRAGLGVVFDRAVDELLRRISGSPERYPLVSKRIRLALLHRFPFGIYYRIASNHLFVVAVHHSSRDPSVWQERS